MILTLDIWKSMLLSAADLFNENVEQLTALDAVIGDADHGNTVGKIGNVIREEALNATETGQMFNAIGKKLMSLPGGSACPLYGLFFQGFAKGLGEGACDVLMMRAMFEAAAKKLGAFSGAKLGDKTMMDAVLPATEVIKTAEGTPAQILRAAAEAANSGAKATEQFVSKFGRAKSYGERTLGVADPGATSMSLFYEGCARALEAL
ncbi:MAG: DAK2 domain-containing protein [Christensenellales bacterium]|jgi:dihydroxyacetone kinase-like protein